jgi:hypothetical protein
MQFLDGGLNRIDPFDKLRAGSSREERAHDDKRILLGEVR